MGDAAPPILGRSVNHIKGGFKSEDTGKCFHCQHKYSKSLSWAENLNISSDLKSPLIATNIQSFFKE
jgi:hypothetical protein